MLELERRRFTVDEYLRMWDAGIFDDEDRLELIEGEILVMPPAGPPHASTTSALDQRLTLLLGMKVIIWGQNPLRIGDWSLPMPDVVVLQPDPDWYATRHPVPADVLVLVEVCDTSEAKDRRVKAPLYARAGVPELWLVLLKRDHIEVHTDPGPDGYRNIAVLRRGDVLSPAALPEVQLPVDEVLGRSRG
jgi:Uma2 family endonuclease